VLFDTVTACGVLMHEIWRGGRVAEGAPLLREYGVDSSIEGSNPSLSATTLLVLNKSCEVRF
jgi:hypothetical protein